MSKIEIDFNKLKYNLYELLNVDTKADSTKIKKSFMKIIKNFHPDKNSELEEDIYYHIILANQILLNSESRKKYDDFISGSSEIFIDMKKSFNKTINSIDQYFPSKDSSKHEFEKKIVELNTKHGYTDESNKDSVMTKFTKIQESRSSDIKIEKEKFNNMKEFNEKFTINKSEGGRFQDQLVEYKGVPQELSTYVVGEQYTNIQDLDKLYVEDSVQGSKYSSLDRAFLLHSVNMNIDQKSIEEKIKEYKTNTELYKGDNNLRKILTKK